MHKLYMCQTCERDATLPPGSPSRGALLTRAVLAELERTPVDDVLVLRVPCLNGCLNPCNIALRAPRKYSLRLSRLEADHAAAVIELLGRYVEDSTGELTRAEWPVDLASHISARVPPPHLLAGS